jgi:hypothetical protein
MKTLKISLLLILTLAAMRASSWLIAWAMSRFMAASVRTLAIIANLIAFLSFLLLLYFNLMPGEPMDWAAVLFGLILFTIYTASDLFWRPWKQKL